MVVIGCTGAAAYGYVIDAAFDLSSSASAVLAPHTCLLFTLSCRLAFASAELCVGALVEALPVVLEVAALVSYVRE